MSFLFKFFRSNKTDSTNKEDLSQSQLQSQENNQLNNDNRPLNNDNDQNLSTIPESNDIIKEEKKENLEEPATETDDDDDDDSLLGGPFETMEAELNFLRQQNNQLKAKVKYHKSKRNLFKKNCIKSSDIISMKINGKIVNVRKPESNMSLDELSKKVQERLPRFLQRKDQSKNETIYVPSDLDNEIGIIDIRTVDHIELVQFDKMNKNNALSTFNQNDNNLQYENTDSLGGAFIVLREQDVVDAIACFVAQCVMNIPECHNLDNDEMMKMINGTFLELKKKGPLGKMMDWGGFVYSTYGYTSTAYVVYTNAAMAKTILSCMLSAAFFIGVL